MHLKCSQYIMYFCFITGLKNVSSFFLIFFFLRYERSYMAISLLMWMFFVWYKKCILFISIEALTSNKTITSTYSRVCFRCTIKTIITRQHWDGDYLKGPCFNNKIGISKNFALTLTYKFDIFQLAKNF